MKIVNSTPRFLSLWLMFFMLSMTACNPTNLQKSTASKPLTDVIENVKDSRNIADKAPLALPVSVAILFAPSAEKYAPQLPLTTLYSAADSLKKQLLSNQKYIKSVTLIANDDLTGKLSLLQIRSLYAVDVLVLLSFQQDQHSTQNGAAGLADMTIIGAFLVPGVKIATATLVDGKIIHIPSQSLIFKTTGTDQRETYSSSYARSANGAEESTGSLLAASDDFGKSAIAALSRIDQFDTTQAIPLQNLLAQTDAPKANDYWQKVDAYKSTGGGSLTPEFSLSALALCLVWLCQR